MAHPSEWKELARGLWEKGWKPSRVIDAVRKEYGHTLKYTTLASWAGRGKWKHFEDADTPKNLNPNEPAGVSGIADPIYHLSLVLGKRMVREDFASRSLESKEYGSRPSAIVAKALAEVDINYDPGPDTIDYLKPVLTRYVNTIRRATKAGKENRLNEDPERNRRSQNRLARGMQEILAEALAKGIEIDGGHAGLDIVPTNPQEPEVKDDE